MADRIADVDRLRARATTPAGLFSTTDIRALIEHIDWLQDQLDQHQAADAYQARLGRTDDVTQAYLDQLRTMDPTPRFAQHIDEVEAEHHAATQDGT